MEIDELFGLPAHPLIVHMPVVLVPLALAAAVLAFWRPARLPAVLAAAAFAGAGAVGALLAAGSGERLEARIQESDLVEEHTEAGEAVRLPAVGFAVVALVAAGAELGRRRAPVPWAGTAALVVAVGVGALATAAVVDAGHSGSTAVWEGLPTEAEAREARDAADAAEDRAEDEADAAEDQADDEADAAEDRREGDDGGDDGDDGRPG